MKQYNAYLVQVKTTNGLKNTFVINNKYYSCDNGEIVVLADSLTSLIQGIGEENILKIKYFGIGDVVMNENQMNRTYKK